MDPFFQFDSLDKMKHFSLTGKNRERSLQRGLQVESDAEEFERAIGKFGCEYKELTNRTEKLFCFRHGGFIKIYDKLLIVVLFRSD